MKAAILHGPDDLRIEEVPRTPLRHGEARICIEAALTCGTDLKVFRRGTHSRMLHPPSAFGHEMAGTITELGPGAHGWAPDERVVVANSAPCGSCSACHRGQENLCDDLLFLNGAYAESIVVPERIVQRNLLRLDPSISFPDGALTEPLACVVKGIEDCEIRHGQRVLVIGSGPIGLMFVRLCAELGCAVTVRGRGELRLARARKLGATVVKDVPGELIVAGPIPPVGATPFDAVIEAVGKPETWKLAVDSVRKGGTVNLFGGCPPGTRISLDASRIHYSDIRLRSSFHHTPRTVRKALEWIQRGVVRAADFVDGECTLNDLPDLFRSMAEGNRAVKTLVRTR